MYSITNEQKILVHVSALTENNNPTTLTVVPAWAVTSGDCTLVVAEDGLSAYVVSGSTASTTNVTVTAQISDSVTLANSFDVEVTLAEASKLEFTADAPETK